MNNKCIKTLYNDDIHNIWVESISNYVTRINVTDVDNSVTYHIADFNGSKYQIKHNTIFNNVYIKTAKNNKKIIKQLLNFHGGFCDDDVITNDLKIKLSCLCRRITIYIKKNKVWLKKKL